MDATPVPQVSNQNELADLYAKKGELVTQLEVGQAQLQQINNRLAQILGINQQVPIIQK